MGKSEAQAMKIGVIAELTKNVTAAFPDVEVHMAGGVPVGMVLTVRWDAQGTVTASALQIEAET